MKALAAERLTHLQIIFVLIVSVLTAFLLQQYSVFHIIGIVGILILIIAAISNLQKFLIVLLALKPFIDLTWNNYLFSIGSESISALHLAGFLVFAVGGYLYFFKRDKGHIFNEKLIWIFIGLNIFSNINALLFYKFTGIHAIDSLLRIFDAYFIYFIFHRFLTKNAEKLRIIKIIWLSTFLVSIFSVLMYAVGVYDIDITQQVTRFAGLYNDPGVPSYLAIMSLVFGTLYLEISKKEKTLKKKFRIYFIVNIIMAFVVLNITVTKSAFVMLVIFAILWIGGYKKKIYILLPLLAVTFLYVFIGSKEFRGRFDIEIQFLQNGEYSIDSARPLGTGRVGLWESVINQYILEYDLSQQLFGTARTFGAHNQYIVYLMHVGLVGLMTFLLILFRFFRRLVIRYKKFKKPEIYIWPSQSYQCTQSMV